MIKIDDTYSIETDERSYNVIKTMVTKEGKTNKVAQAYCCCLEDALKWIINKKHRDFIASGEFTLKEALKELERIKKEIEGLMEVK